MSYDVCFALQVLNVFRVQTIGILLNDLLQIIAFFVFVGSHLLNSLRKKQQVSTWFWQLRKI